MTLITSAGANPEERFQVLNDLIQSFNKVPLVYLRAMSVPILHHLAGIGSVLEFVFEKPLSEDTFLNVRAVIVHLADLLQNLEKGTSPREPSASASNRLHTLLAQMDVFMRTQRATISNQQMMSTHQHQHPQYMLQNHASSDSAIGLQVQGGMSYGGMDPNSEFSFPSEVLDDWGWAFDFTQMQR